MTEEMRVIENVSDSNVIRVFYRPKLPDNFMGVIQDFITEKISTYGNFTIHLDLRGLNITTLTKNIPWIESMMGRFDANTYEQYLSKVYIYNAPFIARHVYLLIGRFVRNIKSKIIFVPKEKKSAAAASSESAVSI